MKKQLLEKKLTLRTQNSRGLQWCRQKPYRGITSGIQHLFQPPDASRRQIQKYAPRSIRFPHCRKRFRPL